MRALAAHTLDTTRIVVAQKKKHRTRCTDGCRDGVGTFYACGWGDWAQAVCGYGTTGMHARYGAQCVSRSPHVWISLATAGRRFSSCAPSPGCRCAHTLLGPLAMALHLGGMAGPSLKRAGHCACACMLLDSSDRAQWQPPAARERPTEPAGHGCCAPPRQRSPHTMPVVRAAMDILQWCRQEL